MVELVSMIVGALVGAGFSSGRELMTFFVSFGPEGFYGLAVMVILFGLCSYLVVWLCRKLSLDSYQELLNAIFPKRWAKIMEGLMSLGLWLGLGMMLVGLGTLGAQLWHWQESIGFWLGLGGVFLPLWLGGGDGFLKLNGYLLPILVVLSAAIGLKFLSQPINCTAGISLSLVPSWQAASLLYLMYNLLLAIAMLVSVRQREGVYIALITACLIIGGLGLILCSCLSLLPTDIQRQQMPLLTIAERMGDGFGYCYAIVMVLAMYTTALANTYGLLVNYQRRTTYRGVLLAGILLTETVFLPFDFGQLVAVIYPLLGYAGIPIVAAMMIKAVKLHFGGKLWRTQIAKMNWKKNFRKKFMR